MPGADQDFRQKRRRAFHGFQAAMRQEGAGHHRKLRRRFSILHHAFQFEILRFGQLFFSLVNDPAVAFSQV